MHKYLIPIVKFLLRRVWFLFLTAIAFVVMVLICQLIIYCTYIILICAINVTSFIWILVSGML